MQGKSSPRPQARPVRLGRARAGTLLILATAALWSVLGVLAKYCMAGGMTPLECAFWRCAFGAAAFFLHLGLTGRTRIPPRHALIFLLFGAWGMGVYYACAQFTIKLVGAAMDIILQYTAPFWVAVFARVLFGERLGRTKALAMGIAALGTLFVCLSGGSLPDMDKNPLAWLGVVTGLVTGLCYATHYPFTRWWQGRHSGPTLFAWMLTGGALALLLANLAVAGPPRLGHPPGVWCASAATGLFCTYLAFVCYGEALKRIGLVRAVVTSELEPVLSMTWAWLLFGECFRAIGWAGSALIILSVLVMSLGGADGKTEGTD